MSDLSDLILDFFPNNGDVGVPLLSDITLTLSGENYDTNSIVEGLFVEGPDTDQLVGPGLLSQVHPDNISQGDFDDFLQSPGYLGIVQGTTTVTGIDGNTVVTFNPTLPMAALTLYRVNLTGVTTSGEDTIDGFVTWSFTTGSGSITELPSDVSTSVLSASIVEASQVGLAGAIPLRVTKVSPLDHSVENPTSLEEIVIDFNKPIDVNSIAGNLSVKTVPATDHPSAQTNSLGDLAIVTIVEGNRLRIKL